MAAHAHTPPDRRTHDRPPLEVADIIRAHGEQFRSTHTLTPEQSGALRDLARCRTAALGGHMYICQACKVVLDASYNSCRNRHCPKCQSLEQVRWVNARMERMLPTASFHAVFTLPRELRRLTLANRQTVFDMLFACATATLQEFGRDPKHLGAELGITSVLHTWTRELRFHPHVHCIVTAGGLSLDGERWVAGSPNYLFAVRALGKSFRKRFVDALRKARTKGQLHFTGPAESLADSERFHEVCERLRHKRWVVYCKPPFGDRDQAFHYLGQYTHRVGISNQRLVSMNEHGVTFRTRGDARVTVPPGEFLRRFVLHVLPKGFVKIRHHGLFAAGNIATKLATARTLLTLSAAAGTGAATVKATPAMTGVLGAAMFANAGAFSASTATESKTTVGAAGVVWNGGVPRDPGRTAGGSADFRDLLFELNGVDLRRCPHCGERAVTRFPIDAAALAARAPPGSVAS